MRLRFLWILCCLSANAATGCAHNASEQGGEAQGDQRAAGERVSGEPEDPRAAQVLYDKGQAALSQGDLPRARTAFAELASRFPLDAHADEVKRNLAHIDLQQKHYGDAEQSLKSLYAHTPPAERPQAARVLAEAAEGAGDATEAVRDWCEIYRLDPAQQSDATTALGRLVETQLSANDAARLAGDLPSDCPAQEPIAFKRAQVLAHLGDPQAQGALTDALGRYPTSRFAPNAKAAVERLAARATQSLKPGTIALLVPQTPESAAAYGKAALDGLRLALGPDAPLVVRDTKGDPAEAARAVEELAGQGVQVIIGPILAGESEAAAVKAQELGVPLVTLTRAEGITRLGNYIFRNMLTDSAQARALAHYAVDVRGFKRFAVLFPEVDYGKEMMTFFWDAVEQKGGHFHGAEGYPFDTTTFKAYAERLVGRADLELRRDWRDGVRDINEKGLNQIQKKRALRALRESLDPIVDFDAIFVADSARNVALLAPQLAVENVVTDGCNQSEMRRIYSTTGDKPKTVELLGWTAWYDPDFDLVERAGRYVQCSVFVDGFFLGSARPETKAFVAAFQKEYNRAPGLVEAEAYDTGKLVAEALKSAPASRAAFRDAFATLKGIKVATGDSTVSIDREVDKPLFFVTITDKGYEELDLSKLARPGEAPGG